MIQVYAEHRGDRCRLYVSGHANKGTERDAVCAGVSALTGALILYAVDAPSCRHVRYIMEPGEVFLSCCGLGESFELVVGGLCAIAAAYPGHVKIESRS